MACDYTIPPVGGKHTDVGVPVKCGQPLSSACERLTVIGAIPHTIRYPGWVLVSGAPSVNVVSDGGIENPASFFKNLTGCYQSEHAQPSGGSTCA